MKLRSAPKQTELSAINPLSRAHTGHFEGHIAGALVDRHNSCRGRTGSDVPRFRTKCPGKCPHTCPALANRRTHTWRSMSCRFRWQLC